jgi:hypothetical protein
MWSKLKVTLQPFDVCDRHPSGRDRGGLRQGGEDDLALAARGAHERPYISEVRTSLAQKIAIIAWQAEEPAGAAALLSLVRGPGPSHDPKLWARMAPDFFGAHMTQRTLAVAALAAFLLTGCATVGPRTIPPARFAYGEALARSGSEQLLLNLVRLRYRDTPLFLEVGSVVTQYQASLGVAANAKGADAGGSDELSLGANANYTEQPTITYAPLQGEDFVARLLSPISPANIVLLSQSGWSIERLLLCCVQKVNGLRNATGAAGPTPDYVPEFNDFLHMAHQLRQLQKAGLVEAEMSEDQKSILIHLEHPPAGPLEEAERDVRKLLGLDPGATTLRVIPELRPKEHDEIAVTGRSLLSVLFYLSQSVEPPLRDEQAGRVTVTKDASGKRFDWAAATGGLMHVHSGDHEPSGAAVRVRYRGSWFWIADDDLDSKTTFSLLTYLFSLKAGSREMKEPLLTLGVH